MYRALDANSNIAVRNDAVKKFALQEYLAILKMLKDF
jgi:hypothetical protein